MGTNFLILILVTIILLTGVILDHHFSGGKVIDERRKRKRMAKKRTLNELRQEKEFGYTQSNHKEKLITTIEEITEMVKNHPNDTDLGSVVRNYINQLKK